MDNTKWNMDLIVTLMDALYFLMSGGYDNNRFPYFFTFSFYFIKRHTLYQFVYLF